ncbi:universal stress protein [Aliiroseovarius sp. PTFE2010]|uniref:universal stress protein n=1 Tax=Aliiroseovarius sp. PTFE2010 TaxID=3417190 RepID=UPI003CF8B162
MYATILLCYDGSREGRLALREGAKLAQITGAAVHLLAVVETSSVSAMAQAADAEALRRQQADFEAVLEEGRHRLTAMGLEPVVRMEFGDPVATITRIADELGADLVIAGHHRDGFWSHWLRRSVTAELGDRLKCSLLLAQKVVEDSELFPKT